MYKNENEIFDLIATHVADISSGVQREKIVRSSMLSPLGVGLIGRAELIARIQEELSLDGSTQDFYKANNLGELASIFEQKLKD